MTKHRQTRISALLSATAALALVAALAPGATAADLTSETLHNPTAYIPSQCYTRIVDDAHRVHNPCFTCHARSRTPTWIHDDDLQMSYALPAPALKNPWTNLFNDRSAEVAATSDADILSYIRTDNYRDADGGIVLAKKLADLPAGWDADGDGKWSGFVPDCHFSFDDEGFDRDPAGTPTGWRAFAYAPLPGGFWPTNGSTDDVLIRLAEPYRQNASGGTDLAVYKINLAIVEALITRRNVPIEATDETRYGVDLDRDGSLGTATQVTYDWAPLDGRDMSYVGAAKALQEKGQAPLAAGLYPLGTEFLHTVRYIDIDDATGEVKMAPHMKEVRYMVKTRWQTYADREEGHLAEAKERADFPDRIAMFFGDLEHGISNGTGWRLQAFIEAADGSLRPQTFEETVFCMGCHGGIGVTDDDVFAFSRKLGAKAHNGGWYHWTQKGLRGVPDPVRADGEREFAYYLKNNGAGDEFRNNREIIEKFFDAAGAPRPEMLDALKDDVAVLLYPSAERAMTLNKAYRLVVREQSFARGRDAVVAPPKNVYRDASDADDESAPYVAGRQPLGAPYARRRAAESATTGE